MPDNVVISAFFWLNCSLNMEQKRGWQSLTANFHQFDSVKNQWSILEISFIWHNLDRQIVDLLLKTVKNDFHINYNGIYWIFDILAILHEF